MIERTIFEIFMREIGGEIGPVYIESMEQYEWAFGGVAVLDRPGTEEEVDDGGRRSRNDDWYTIKGRPWSCDCGMSKPYMAEDQHPHRIIVWPKKDDPNMLRTLRSIREDDGEVASVVRYEASMGPCVSHYELTPS